MALFLANNTQHFQLAALFSSFIWRNKTREKVNTAQQLGLCCFVSHLHCFAHVCLKQLSRRHQHLSLVLVIYI